MARRASTRRSSIECTCAEVKRVTVRFSYRVMRGEEVLTDGDTLLACVGHDMALKRIPDDIADAFRRAEIPLPASRSEPSPRGLRGRAANLTWT